MTARDIHEPCISLDEHFSRLIAALEKTVDARFKAQEERTKAYVSYLALALAVAALLAEYWKI